MILPYSVLDRLSNLYKTGINTYLKIQVLDYSNDDFMKEIKLILVDRKNKDILLQKFQEIRFIKNNEFAFIEVFNKDTFEQNALILKEVIKLFQDVRIKYSDKQQFLGEFFELLLNIGIKQAEGQFFTPIPIANFIVNSLPVKEIIEEKINKGQEDFLPYMIDFACGAGHFLTEFMHRVEPLLGECKSNNFTKIQKDNYNKYTSSKYAWAEYFVYGIEKDYRLTKTSKVACFLNGDGSANIITGNGIANFDSEDYQNTILYQQTDKEEYSKDCEKFDILIANPPYSVQNFKDLFIKNENSDGNRIFDLFSSLGENSDDIECLFVERMKQLVKPKGYAGIILPVSILTNEGIHQEARKLLIENFKIKAIVELGSGAFMVTGTKTCVLFLEKREKEEIEKIDTYLNKFKTGLSDFTYKETPRIITQFLEDTYENIVFKDYITLFRNPNDTIKQCDLYQEFYENEYKEAEKEYDSLLNKKKKELNKRENAKKINITLINKLKTEIFDIEQKGIIVDYTKLLNVELEKIRCYLLNYKIETVIVKASNEQDEVKDFLGYEFSKRKGNEGLKEISPALEEEFNTYTNRNNIHSKLYNPSDINDNTKVSYYVYKNFINSLSDNDKELIKELVADNTFITCENNLFNFEDNSYSRGKINAYNYKIDVNKKKIKIESKWNIHSINKIVSTIESGSRPKGGIKNNSLGVYSIGGEHIDNSSGLLKLTNLKFVSKNFYNKCNQGKIKKNDILICKDGALTGKIALVRDELDNIPAMVNEHVFILRCENNITQKYLFYMLLSPIGQSLLKARVTGSAQGGLNSTNLKAVKVPLPPLETQQKIVVEIEEVEKEYNKNVEKIKRVKFDIDNILKKYPIGKLSQLCDVIKEKCKPQKETKYNYIGLEHIKSNTGIVSEIVKNGSNLLSEKNIYYKNCVLYGKLRPYLNKVGIAVQNGVCSTDIVVLKTELPLILKYLMLSENFVEQAMSKMAGTNHPRISVEDLLNIKIPVPPLSEHQKIVAQIEELEKQIAEAQAVIDISNQKKQEILDNYLK